MTVNVGLQRYSTYLAALLDRASTYPYRGGEHSAIRVHH